MCSDKQGTDAHFPKQRSTSLSTTKRCAFTRSTQLNSDFTPITSSPLPARRHVILLMGLAVLRGTGIRHAERYTYAWEAVVINCDHLLRASVLGLRE